MSVPRWFTEYGYLEHFLTPGKTLLGSEMMNEFRRVFTDKRPAGSLRGILKADGSGYRNTEGLEPPGTE